MSSKQKNKNIKKKDLNKIYDFKYTMKGKRKILDLVIFICALSASTSLFLIKEDYGEIITFVFLIIGLGISWFRRDIYDLMR